MGQRRISSNIFIFNQQITSMDDLLQSVSTNSACVAITVAECLGVLPADATEWHARRLLWDGPTGLFAKYNNPVSRPLVDGKNGDVAVFIRSFQQFAERPLNAVANSSNCTSELALVFNVVPVALRANPTHPTHAIEEDCLPTVNVLGGGDQKVKCYSDHDASRPSKPKGADSVQVAFKIGVTPPVINHPPDDPASEPSPEACPQKEIFTKSTFVLRAGAGNATKKLFAFTRWYNSKHPELSGQWSPMVEVPIA